MIKDFFTAKSIAVAGASRNEKKFGNIVCRKLKEFGFTVFPVNPSGETICNLTSYKNISSLPLEATHLIILTRKERTEELVNSALAKGIKNIWIQQTSETLGAVEAAKNAGANVISGKCLFMYSDPVRGAHRFHRGIKKVCGKFEE
jgi:uncharacterized protein